MDESDPNKSKIKEDSVLQPDMSNYLSSFPKCRALLIKIRSTANMENKTPASVINEYAVRLGLVVIISIN